MITRRFPASARACPHLAFLIGPTLALSSCGAGTAAAVAGGGDSGGDANGAPSISAFSVTHANDPQECRVQFTLRDPEGDPANVELLYEVPGAPPQRISQIAPVADAAVPPSNPAALDSSASGVSYAFQWHFSSESLLPRDGAFVGGTRVVARLQATNELVPGANVHAGIGNDPPQVTAADAPKEVEVVGIAAVPFTVADSTDDAVSIRAEFDVVGDEPDAGWQIARPAGISAAERTPEFAFNAVVAPADGEDLVFFWNTNFDLADLERDVVVRFVAADEIVSGRSMATPQFHVDNNEEPVVTVSEGLLVLTPDERAGIPILYTVRDEESDDVDVVFQWKRPDESYPALPDSPAAIADAFADPLQREALHLCSEYATWAAGRAVSVASDSIRALVPNASLLAVNGLEGREIEFLRSSRAPTQVGSAPLDHPAAALAAREGTDALVLDRAGAGAWRLRQIDLATGAVTRVIVPTAPGEPSAMAFERHGKSVLVASDTSGSWKLQRVPLDEGSIELLAAFDGSSEAGVVRGVASVGLDTALVTVGSSLIRVDFASGQRVRLTTLFDDLATPWGIAADPFDPHRFFVAERDSSSPEGTGRILSFRIDTLERVPIVEHPVRLYDDVLARPFSRPEALAVDRSGCRLLAVSQSEPREGTWQVASMDLRPRSESRAEFIATDLSEPPSGVGVGDDGLVLLTRRAASDLCVGGGVQQRRTIDAFDAEAQELHVSVPYSPPLTPGQSFRVRAPRRAHGSSPAGTRSTFVWDSSDVRTGGAVQFRAVPMDAEVGVDAATEIAKQIRSPFDSEPVSIPLPADLADPSLMTAADLDRDGDVDIVVANPEHLLVYLQTSAGEFATSPIVLGDETMTSGPISIATADMDGDGDLDLVSANVNSQTLTTFFQTRPGEFAAIPLTLRANELPWSVVAADVDRDGRNDLVSLGAIPPSLDVFLQTRPGHFEVGSIALSDAMGFPTHLLASDLDGDGDVDVAVANLSFGSNNSLNIHFQTNPGQFDATPLSLGFGILGQPSGLAAADLDQDGDVDIVFATSNGPSLFFQTAPGVFDELPQTIVADTPISSGPVVVGDWDLDGDADLACGSGFGKPVVVFFQTTPGEFDEKPLLFGPEPVTAPTSGLIAADFDGDGRPDFAYADGSLDLLRVFFSAKRGGFESTPLTLQFPATVPEPNFVAAADADGDGDIDLLTNGLIACSQTSPGAFATPPHPIQQLGLIAGAITPADMDGDNDLDFVCTQVFFASLPVVVGYQTTPGVIGSFVALGDPEHFIPAVCVGDLDGDRDFDIAHADHTADALIVHFQTAAGTFAEPPLVVGNVSVTNQVGDVLCADLDGDGDLDLASAGFNAAIDGRVAIFFQTSAGEFGAQPFSLVADSTLAFWEPQGLLATDVDGDCDFDLVVTNGFSRSFSIFSQTSPGVFARTATIGDTAFATFSLSRVVADDFDGDGDVDLAVANPSDDVIAIHEQLSPGEFDRTPRLLGAPGMTHGPGSLTAADVDGDGDVDLVSANTDARALTVFWNNH